jgi:uncharacterized protein (TIGR03066 family)
MTHKTKVVLALALVGVAVWAGFGRSANKKKVVGTWTLISGGYGGKEALEFSADGKMKGTASWEGKQLSYDGTYKVNGDKIEMTVPDDEGSESGELKQQVMTISSLSDRELILANEKGRKKAYKRS